MNPHPGYPKISHMNKILLLLLPLVFCISPVHSQNTFIEINGEVAIEAEYYTDNTGAWEEVEGRNAYPIEKSGLGILRSDRIRLVQNREILGSIQDEVTLARTRVGLPLCRPLPSASILAPANEPEDFASLFVYEKGAELSGYGHRKEGWSCLALRPVQTGKRKNCLFNWSGGPPVGPIPDNAFWLPAIPD